MSFGMTRNVDGHWINLMWLSMLPDDDAEHCPGLFNASSQLGQISETWRYGLSAGV